MKVKKICAEDFRNIERAEVEFSDGINLLFGANAQGKTNLLEAICYFSLGKSFRGAKDAEFMQTSKKPLATYINRYVYCVFQKLIF